MNSWQDLNGRDLNCPRREEHLCNKCLEEREDLKAEDSKIDPKAPAEKDLHIGQRRVLQTENNEDKVPEARMSVSGLPIECCKVMPSKFTL